MRFFDIGLGIVAIVVGVGVYKKYLSTGKDNSNDAVDNASKKYKRSNLTYSLSTYTDTADDLLLAMKGIGANCQKVLGLIFQTVKNQDDWYYLITVFGRRRASYILDPLNLYEWLTGDCPQIRSKIRLSFSRKGITY